MLCIESNKITKIYCSFVQRNESNWNEKEAKKDYDRVSGIIKTLIKQNQRIKWKYSEINHNNLKLKKKKKSWLL